MFHSGTHTQRVNALSAAAFVPDMIWAESRRSRPSSALCATKSDGNYFANLQAASTPSSLDNISLASRPLDPARVGRDRSKPASDRVLVSVLLSTKLEGDFSPVFSRKTGKQAREGSAVNCTRHQPAVASAPHPPIVARMIGLRTAIARQILADCCPIPPIRASSSRATAAGCLRRIR